MSADIDLAKKLGIRYRITPSGIEELHGTVRVEKLNRERP